MLNLTPGAAIILERSCRTSGAGGYTDTEIEGETGEEGGGRLRKRLRTMIKQSP